MLNLPKIYLASPLGFSESGRFFMYEKLIPSIEYSGYSVINPWDVAPKNLIEKANLMDKGIERTIFLNNLNSLIGDRNIDAIDSCLGIFAVLDGVDVDSGVASEIGYGYAIGKTIMGYRNDFRNAGDNEASKINLQVERFIELSNGKIVCNLENIKEELDIVFK